MGIADIKLTTLPTNKMRAKNEKKKNKNKEAEARKRIK